MGRDESSREAGLESFKGKGRDVSDKNLLQDV